MNENQVYVKLNFKLKLPRASSYLPIVSIKKTINRSRRSSYCNFNKCHHGRRRTSTKSIDVHVRFIVCSYGHSGSFSIDECAPYIKRSNGDVILCISRARNVQSLSLNMRTTSAHIATATCKFHQEE
jgi:hypothetical protein